MSHANPAPDHPEAVAIIGYAGRFPGAASIAQLWANLRGGVESIRFFSEAELVAAGVDPELVRRPDYVPAKGQMDGAELFDASFFGYTPREATVLDPQQRLFLECAWEALEDAGYIVQAPGVAVGVYAACSINTYLLRHWTTDAFRSLDGLELLISSDKDFLATRVAYKLDLKGPAVVVQTACSSSLSAVCTAAQSLLGYQCDIALAGGVSVNNPRVSGYVYRQGAIMSPDGHCRAFDADAKGTVSGEGVGIVVLKRLSEAIADRDTIHAVVKGFALNNDGANKIGYTAPSVDGQVEVIRLAQAFAGVGPDQIGYIEAHGTGTDLGDPIEMAALTQAFHAGTRRRQYCGIGSVKTNFGHLDAAAGVTGLLKAALALEQGEIPPTLHFKKPNPHIDFGSSPFYVVDRLMPWPRGAVPRRAGVSAFGIGGTNAHVVLEEAPPAATGGPSRPQQLLVLSARSEAALREAQQRLADHLAANAQLPLPDVGHTLQVGRRAFDWRCSVVCTNAADGSARLARAVARKVAADPRPVVFAFSGQGTQYPGMAAGLYRDEPTFRAAMDECLAHLVERAGLDLKPLLYPAAPDEATAAALRDTRHAQPALFATSYALARTWMAWGVQPEAMIGHSVGEYVAACIAGVMTLADALELIALRGRLISALPAGSMLAVPMAEAPLQRLLRPELAMAAVNAPKLCVVSGETPSVDAFETELRNSGLEPTRLHTSHAFHSRMLDPVLDEFGRAVGRVALSAPRLRLLSNLSGDWMRAAEATDPRYWVRHMRETVRFSAGVQRLLEEPSRVVLEVGPGATLTGLVRQHVPPGAAGDRALASMRSPRDEAKDLGFMLGTLGRLWEGGVAVDWKGFAGQEERRRVPLPTYAFQRRNFWVDVAGTAAAPEASQRKIADMAHWLHVPSWRQAPRVPSQPALRQQRWLVFYDALGLGQAVVARLRQEGAEVAAVEAGAGFAAPERGRRFVIDPASEDDHRRLFEALDGASGAPEVVLHLWGLGDDAAAPRAWLDRCFWSPTCTVREAGRRAVPMRLLFVTSGAQAVLPGDPVVPEKATLAGPVSVGPKEYTRLDCRQLDLALGAKTSDWAPLVEALLAESAAAATSGALALRGGQRWQLGHEALPLPNATRALPLREASVVLVTGGLGGIGLALARGLAESGVRPTLVLVGRQALPPREAWSPWLDAHPANEPASARLRALLALEAAGATVCTAQADVADRAAMQAVVDDARRRFGPIRGVIHSAGVPAGGIIELKTRAAADAILAPKVEGTRVLESVLDAAEPDFFVLCSSLTATLGSAGQVDYTAANAFLDAWAQSRRGAPGLTLSIQWDTWSESGMAAQAELPGAMAEMRQQALQAGIRDTEGIELFRRALGCPVPQLLVSTRDLARRLQPAAPPVPATVPSADAADDGAPADDSRRGLSADYVAPRTETERIVAAAWQDLFGIPRMGIHDNFFEADGHSLLAIQIVARLATDTGIKLPVNAIFESPTIAQVAERIEADRAKPADDERELAEALAKVEQLSDEEVARLLEKSGRDA